MAWKCILEPAEWGTPRWVAAARMIVRREKDERGMRMEMIDRV
jgi:hypothetical protein